MAVSIDWAGNGGFDAANPISSFSGNNSGPLFDLGHAWRQINGAADADKFNAEQAEIQRNFEERLSNTAYQRAVLDMKRAGLNPAMLYGSGGAGPASTPTGSSARSSGTGGEGFMGMLKSILMIAATRGIANRIYASVNSSGSVPAAVKQANSAMEEITNYQKPSALAPYRRYYDALWRDQLSRVAQTPWVEK